MKKVQLHEISCTRSGDKGPNSNVGIVFYNEEIYKWAVVNLTASLIKNHFKSIVKGNVVRYELPNLYALNFPVKEIHEHERDRYIFLNFLLNQILLFVLICVIIAIVMLTVNLVFKD